jgi:hypothetical protein
MLGVARGLYRYIEPRPFADEEHLRLHAALHQNLDRGDGRVHVVRDANVARIKHEKLIPELPFAAHLLRARAIDRYAAGGPVGDDLDAFRRHALGEQSSTHAFAERHDNRRVPVRPGEERS